VLLLSGKVFLFSAGVLVLTVSGGVVDRLDLTHNNNAATATATTIKVMADAINTCLPRPRRGATPDCASASRRVASASAGGGAAAALAGH
jgi:hypothetical protein